MSETIAVITMLLVRIGVPLLVIFGLSYLAYRWIAEDRSAQAIADKQTIADASRVTIGGPAPLAQVLYAGTHCWDVKGCTAEMKAKCPAVARPEIPCWLAVQMKTGHLMKDCPDCGFYDRPVARA
jgi:hypothetical protein